MMMRCTTCFRVWALLFLTVSLIWTGGEQEAQAEETVNVYFAVAKELVLPLLAEFENASGIHVNAVRLSTVQALDRVIAEKNDPRIDVLLGLDSGLCNAGIKEGLFEPYTPPAYDLLEEKFKHPDGYWVATTQNPLVFISNKEFLKELHLEPPSSWYDLLDPAYKGMIQISDPRTSGTAVERVFSILEVFQRDEERAFTYMKQLRAQVQEYTKSGTGVSVKLGQAGAGIVVLAVALEYQQEGFDIVTSFPKEGVGTSIWTISLMKGARNPEAGRKLIDWATSPAMQNLYGKYKLNLLPVHPDVKIEPDLAKLLEGANIFPIDDVFVGENRERITDRWVREVLP